MDLEFRQTCIDRWRRYFGDAPLPIAYAYTDDAPATAPDAPHARCLICNIARVLDDGTPYVYDARTPGCPGGKRYTGFTQRLSPDFDYFLSCGIPGKVEGERYKQSPELVQAFLASQPPFEAPAPSLVFKRWDTLDAHDAPAAVICFATPDVLAGLYTLANYDVPDLHGVIAPMGSGCASVITYPYAEIPAPTPRCILGMFDVSARPCVPPDTLTLTAPMARFRAMVAHMDESFLTTPSWQAVRRRL